jgi:tRNA nucleotidyltransferase (CCA-adding enzyme)
MKVYLVGGAVRDALLNRPVLEKDYVVVGSSVDEMLAKGFQPVGKAFPVFLHPKTKDEYALARTEKKVDKGYHGFVFHASPEVSLEEDLIRRDLTINAMAQDDDGKIIDPYQGKSDLDNKILRHVSDAFLEDPVRILRLARFAARFAYLGFTVAPETTELMRTMVDNGEVDALVPERVWKEMQSALGEKNPEVFFEVLDSCGALKKLLPGLHDFTALKASITLTNDPIIRFACLNFEACKNLKVPTEYQDLARLVSQYQNIYQEAVNLSPEQLLNLLEHLDLFRRPERLEPFVIACHANYPANHFEKSDAIRAAYTSASSVNTARIAQGFTGIAIKKAIHSARIEAIARNKHVEK